MFSHFISSQGWKITSIGTAKPSRCRSQAVRTWPTARRKCLWRTMPTRTLWVACFCFIVTYTSPPLALYSIM